MKLCTNLIFPNLAHGTDLFWTHFKKKDLEVWESVKATLLMRALSISKYRLSCLVYVLAKKTFLVEHLHYTYLLPSTTA